MNEFLSDTKAVFLFLLGAFMSLLAWMGRREQKRIDDLKENSVTRKELAETLRQMRDDRIRMHQENREELRYIRERVDGIADRQ